MNPLAEELNSTLAASVAGASLSALGRRMYFPKGIIAQSGEAKKLAYAIDATIGIATEGGAPLYLPSIREAIPGLLPAEAFPYAPTAGVLRLREAWKRELQKKNPSLLEKSFSLPIVVNGLTHGISIIADLFIDPEDSVIVPDLYWDNYELIFSDRKRARLLEYPFFSEKGGFNLDGLAATLKSVRGGKAVVVLNFPNNPTGYAPTGKEQAALSQLLEAEAAQGTKLVVLCDDAYFGLFFDEAVARESLFASLADLHENILAIKADAATKEELVWGFRVGFLSYAGAALEEGHYEALTKKTMGLIRSSISCSTTPGQNLVLKALEDDQHEARKIETFGKIKNRYLIVKRLVGEMKGPLVALPFNSGYFMTFHSPAGGVDSLRRALLNHYGIGTIAFGDHYLRVAYSSVDAERLPDLLSAIDKASLEVYAKK